MVTNENKIPLMAACIAAAVCLLLFLPAVRYGFVNYDDPDYILNNPVIKGLSREHLAAMFAQAPVGWWMPLTWLSLAIDHHFWGLNPFGYHLTNILLHAANVGIVVLIADRVIRLAGIDRDQCSLGGIGYGVLLFFSGLFFGVHPLRVESVAWVTERKDVLNGLFAFLSILFYLRYVERKEGRGSGNLSGGYFCLSLACFVCSLMAKSVTVVLPAMLLVLDWVPLGRLRNRSLPNLLIEKWPFWGASLLMVLFTILFATQSRYLVTYEAFPLSQRLMVSGNAVWEYLRMLLVPAGLSPLYVIPDPIPVSFALKGVVVATVLCWVAVAGWRRAPRLAAGVLLFLVPLLPVLAFLQNGDQSHADRFTYLPSLSVSIFIALVMYTASGWELARVQSRAAAIGAVLVLVAFSLVTVSQLGVWRNPETFWTRVIQVQPLAINHKERGLYYHATGRFGEAVADFSAALEQITPTLKPYEYNFYAFRAESLREAGRYADSVSDFTTAITLHPHPVYYFHRGLALQAMGRTSDADEDFRRSGSVQGPVVWFE